MANIWWGLAWVTGQAVSKTTVKNGLRDYTVSHFADAPELRSTLTTGQRAAHVAGSLYVLDPLDVTGVDDGLEIIVSGDGGRYHRVSAASGGVGAASRWIKTAAGGETTFSGADDSAVTLAYTAGNESIYWNGVKLVRGTEYTATNGTSFVLVGSTAVAGDTFEVFQGAGATGATGAAGVSAGFLWTFSTTTAMADPGAGIIRFNNATLASVTAIAVDDLSANTGNPDVSAHVLAWDDSTTTTHRGTLRFHKLSASEVYAEFAVTGLTDNAGWTEVAVTFVGSAGTIANTDTLVGVFSRTGNIGATGAAGAGDVTAAANFGTDNRVIRSDGATKGVQSSGVTISDTDVMTVGTGATAPKFDPSGFIELAEISAPSTPAAGFLRMYAKSDNKAYQKDELGVETDLSQAGGGSGSSARNRLINGSMRFNRRAVTSVGDDVYCFDRWYALTQTGAVGISQAGAIENGWPYAIKLTQSQASAQRFGIAQIVENLESTDLRGQTVTLSARVRMSASTTLRYAILEWTGTANSVTSDVVNDWTNGTFTAGNFFISTNLTVTATGSTALTAATPATMSLSVALGSSTNNLIVLFWTDSTQAQNVTLDLGKVRFAAESAASAFEPEPLNDEYDACLRFWRKSFAENTAPVQNLGSYDGAFMLDASAVGTWINIWRFDPPMRTVPTIITYNPNAANANIRNVTDSNDVVVTIANTTAVSTRITCSTDIAIANDRLTIHAVADCEL